jgi:hypothetical protein
LPVRLRERCNPRLRSDTGPVPTVYISVYMCKQAFQHMSTKSGQDRSRELTIRQVWNEVVHLSPEKLPRSEAAFTFVPVMNAVSKN